MDFKKKYKFSCYVLKIYSVSVNLLKRQLYFDIEIIVMHSTSLKGINIQRFIKKSIRLYKKRDITGSKSELE